MFINPLMLAGIGGAVVPLVLHLLAKARYRSIDWGAMLFLESADPRQHQSTRLKQWLLLLIRMALVGLLAVAMARPIVKSDWAGLAGEGRATTVIVLDCSMSMATEEAGRSRFDQARDLVLQTIGSLPRGDRAGMVLAGLPASEQVIEPTGDLQSLLTRAASLKPARSAVDLPRAMLQAADMLEKSEPFNRRLFVITDRQANNWADVDASFATAWRNRTQAGQAPISTVICSVGESAGDNVYIERIELLNPPAIKGQPADLEVSVRNTSPVHRAGIPITASNYGTEFFSSTISIPPQSKTTLKIPFRTWDTGTRFITVAIRSSGQTLDDTMDFAAETSAPLRVLLVSGDERDDASRSKSLFVRAALAPYTAAGRTTGDMAEVTVQPIEKWGSNELAKFDLLALLNVESLAPSQIREIEQFVYVGGGLLVAPGNLSRAEAYTTGMFRDGAGVLPASLAAPVDVEGAVVEKIDSSVPVFGFADFKPASLTQIAVDRIFPATASSTARVIASLAGGQPLVISSAFGRGRVMLTTIPLNTDWSTLPLTGSFLPFMQSAAHFLTAGASPRRNLEVGEPIEMRFDESIDDRSVSVILPSGIQQTPDIIRLQGRTDIHFADTQDPGRYLLRYHSRGREHSEPFVVRTPTRESDLTALTEEQTQKLASDLQCAWIDPTKTSATAVLSPPRASRELWAALLGTVFGLAILEMSLARRWTQEVA